MLKLVNGVIVLSAKPSLVAAATADSARTGTVQAPQGFEQASLGSLVRGFIKQASSFGVFVEFLNGFTALSPKAHLSDLFVSDPRNQFELGQSVIAKVIGLDQDKKQVTLSLKQSECNHPNNPCNPPIFCGMVVFWGMS